MKRVATVLVGLAFVASLAGCGSDGPLQKFQDHRGRGDAPVGDRDDSPKDVINMPNGFSNVASACDGHGHRVFVTTQNTNGKAMWAVADEHC